MILFKACPRCGGDVDATYVDDVRCVQCSHRPDVTYPGPRIIQKAGGEAPNDQAEVPSAAAAARADGALASRGDESPCPRCGSAELVRLDKLRERDNSCYRCRACGHIFSPSAGDAGKRQRATIP